MIFQTKDNFKKRISKKLEKLYNSSNLVELDFFKLCIGLSTIKYNNHLIKQTKNYCILGIKENLPEDYEYNKIVEFLHDRSSINYFNNNRINNKIFKILLNELGLFFISKNQKNHISAFIHLYRVIEKISVMFPLVYLKQSNNFVGVFTDLKDIVTNKDMTSLKFIRNFQKLIFEDVAMLDSSIDFNFIISDSAEIRDLQHIYTIISKEINEASLNGNTITMPFKNIIDFAITIRNRYYHLEIGEKENIEVLDLDMNYFFSVINDYVLNWICVIYYECFKKLNKDG